MKAVLLNSAEHPVSKACLQSFQASCYLSFHTNRLTLGLSMQHEVICVSVAAVIYHLFYHKRKLLSFFFMLFKFYKGGMKPFFIL